MDKKGYEFPYTHQGADVACNAGFFNLSCLSNAGEYSDYVMRFTLDTGPITSFAHYEDNDTILTQVGENGSFQQLSKIDFMRLQSSSEGDEAWLTDQIINFYLTRVLSARQDFLNTNGPDGVKEKRWICSNTYFLHSLLDDRNKDQTKRNKYSEDVGQRWLRHEDFISSKGLLIPFNQGRNHWILVKVDFDRKCISYIDSMCGEGKRTEERVKKRMQAIVTFIAQRWTNLPEKTPHIKETDWSFVHSKDGVSQQNNVVDCGVFVCMYVDYIMLGHALHFPPNLSTPYRKLMLDKLLNFLLP